MEKKLFWIEAKAWAPNGFLETFTKLVWASDEKAANKKFYDWCSSKAITIQSAATDEAIE